MEKEKPIYNTPDVSTLLIFSAMVILTGSPSDDGGMEEGGEI